ncbi:uncharacterized protein LOC105212661 [Zeugodacus cucurbitae]|uniref:Single domain-containing protein n=1 Tax=Zeugodacus cucurbitae TaxID=28588 RepID=A0A0A1WVC0_ZEUCU|nr:uncharacterized protein LOC105212661 [Zeugodacus cucurbitae]
MKSLTILSLALCLFASTQAESYVPNSADPNNPGHCYHKELQLPIKLNETIKPTNVDLCAELTCQEEGLIRVGQCPRVQPNCKDFQYQPTDFTKPYPDCCERYKCNK